jgi:hypothetical protein
MNLGLSVLFALIAICSFIGVGYLWGVHVGRDARDQLRAELSRMNAERGQREDLLSQTQLMLQTAQGQLVEHTQTDASVEPLKDQIRHSMKELLQPLFARDLQARELRDAVNGLLAPMVERERLGLELTRLDASLGAQTGLSQLLGSVAKRAGFSTVLVTDNNGLPMGQNEGAQQVDMLCASLGLLLNMVDRISTNGGAAPLAVALRDADNRVAVHRIFRVDGQRYVLTAVSSGSFLPPDVLDPTLSRIERVLTTKSLA